MTIKHPDCIYCNNRGWFYKYLRHPQFADLTPDLSPRFERFEMPCDCYHGQQYQIWQNRFNHPEYENPLAKLTDEELLRVLEYFSCNQDAIDAEFEL